MGVSRNHVHVIRFHFQTVGCFENAHAGLALQKLGEKTDVFGIQMLDEDERHASVGWQRLEHLRKCLQTSGRGSDSHDRKSAVCDFIRFLRHQGRHGRLWFGGQNSPIVWPFLRKLS